MCLFASRAGPGELKRKMSNLSETTAEVLRDVVLVDVLFLLFLMPPLPPCFFFF